MWSIILMVFFLVTAGAAFANPASPDKNKDLKQSRYGPYHTSGVQGAAKKAYSPFEEHQKAQSQSRKSNDYLKGRLLVKVTPAFKALRAEKQKKILAPHGVVHHERIFPRARPPQAGAMVVSPQGKRIPVPDLTRWYRLKIPETADIPALMEKLQQDSEYCGGGAGLYPAAHRVLHSGQCDSPDVESNPVSQLCRSLL